MTNARSKGWFDVDEQGLAAHVEAQGKARVLLELVQNGWDTEATRVDVILKRLKGSQHVSLRVEDNDPNGYEDLRLAYTLFGRSTKRADPGKRGQFCTGEKLALSVCRRASVRTTKGRVGFTQEGRVEDRRDRTEQGTVVECDLRMTREEQHEVEATFYRLIPPAGKVTTLNGRELTRPACLAEVEVRLPTVVEEGDLMRETVRCTTVRLHAPAVDPVLGQEPSYLYEMGIPVCEVACPWHIDVQQRVPLDQDRQRVRPAYLARVMAAALEAGALLLRGDEAKAAWVTASLGRLPVGDAKRGPGAVAAVRHVVTERFGSGAVAADPSDREATQQAAAEGRCVVHGGSLPSEAWQVVRAADALPAAGQVFPTPRPYSTNPDAPPVEVVPESEWSEGMVRLAELTRWLSVRLGVCRELDVRFVRPRGEGSRRWAACWDSSATEARGLIDFNLTNLGREWADGWHERFPEVVDLVLHEFAHRWAHSHLDQAFHAACTRLAGRLAEVLLLEPASVPHLDLVCRRRKAA